MKIRKNTILSILSIVLVWGFVFFLLFSAPQTADAKSLKRTDPFFAKARLIMTKEEIDIYTHLPDEAARDEFIEEFWKKRDPTPESEENENRIEFENRIAFANKWFKETAKGEGWDTERGRLLLQLGFPDRRQFGELTNVDKQGRLRSSKRTPTEIWQYITRYRLILVFKDYKGFGRYQLTSIPTNLLTSINEAQFSLDLRNQANIKRAFKFNVDYKTDKLIVQIPVKKISFEEKQGKMGVDFGITVYVYRNSKKIDEIKQEKSLQWDKDEILNMKKIEFEIVYPLSKKGKYYFDTVIEEKGSASKYRDFAKTKR